MSGWVNFDVDPNRCICFALARDLLEPELEEMLREGRINKFSRQLEKWFIEKSDDMRAEDLRIASIDSKPKTLELIVTIHHPLLPKTPLNHEFPVIKPELEYEGLEGRSAEINLMEEIDRVRKGNG